MSRDEDGTEERGTTQIGTIVSGLGSPDLEDFRGFVRVMWPNGARHIYQMGANKKYELELAGA